MKAWDLSGGAARLSDSIDLLRKAWADAATRWDDHTSRRFFEDHVEPLEPTTRRALYAIHRLAEVLSRAERECSDVDR